MKTGRVVMRRRGADSSVARRRSSSRRVLAWCGARRWALVVWGAMAVWSAALFAVVRSDYLGFRLARASTSGHGAGGVEHRARAPARDDLACDGRASRPRLAVHVDPILALLDAALGLVPSPLTLAHWPRSSSAALGALPVFWLGRRHLGGRPGCLALAYLANPWLGLERGRPIDPVTLAIPLFSSRSGSSTRIDCGRSRSSRCSMATGELMGLSVAALGVWYALARGRGRAGALIAAESEWRGRGCGQGDRPCVP